MSNTLQLEPVCTCASCAEQKLADAPIACDLSQINADYLDEHKERSIRLFTVALQETQELVDGYALRFKADEYRDLIEFIANERLCCSFFHFNLDVAPQQGPIWLRVSGPEGVKELFAATLLTREPAESPAR